LPFFFGGASAAALGATYFLGAMALQRDLGSAGLNGGSVRRHVSRTLCCEGELGGNTMILEGQLALSHQQGWPAHTFSLPPAPPVASLRMTSGLGVPDE
jgi:hypothetical protein